MKKKIVYISGADSFDVNDVRVAFDEVRNTLNLDPDTVLFGVPVDAAESVGDTMGVVSAAMPDLEPAPVMETESDNAELDDIVVPDAPTPEIAPVAAAPEPDAPVVPILSVLASQEENVVAPEPIAETQETLTAIELDDPDPDIADMINDEMPAAAQEKTLEELLETMTPLQEDVIAPRKKKAAKVEQPTESSDETDATLESLASEFAENQDKVIGTKKGAERGKIGKLKNILPFKKMKRDDSGLMGDLFGWAGIAANDDDFTIPGFFKQKM
ncbi:MAG: hypothetical protein IJQ90_00335 [Alphaproteobacteria bacterium]|nr:hypothetical protein [Alphaproteobacteria bacterium]